MSKCFVADAAAEVAPDKVEGNCGWVVPNDGTLDTELTECVVYSRTSLSERIAGAFCFPLALVMVRPENSYSTSDST